MQIFSGNPDVACQQLEGQRTAVKSATPNSILFLKHFQTKLKSAAEIKTKQNIQQNRNLLFVIKLR